MLNVLVVEDEKLEREALILLLQENFSKQIHVLTAEMCIRDSHKRELTSASSKPLATRTYTGSAQKPLPLLKDGSVTLKNGRDYTLSYTHNVNPGIAKVIAKGKGNYTGSKTVSFTIAKRKVSTLNPVSYTHLI